MPITLSTPIIVPSASFNLLAISNLRIDWPDLNKPPTAVYSLQPYSVDPSGTNTPSPTQPIIGRINDLFSTAAQRAAVNKPALAVALQAVLTCMSELAAEQIANPTM